MTTNKQKVDKVPNLRFPGFEGEWESKKLDSISEFINIKIPSESLSIENYISTENILQNFEGITTASSVPSNINVTSFKDGDILMSNIRPYLKKVWKATKAGGCSSDVLVFRKNETCLSEYLYYLIANDNFINYVMIAAKGVKMPRGDKQQIQQYLISLPSICEQQKIAAFLSLIDERISRLTKIIEGLKSFKSEVINKIFRQQLRFKDDSGNDFPDWQTKKIGDITTVVNNRNKNNEKLPVYSINNKLGFVPQNVQFEGIDSDSRGYDIQLYKIINKNTFAYNPARINVGSIGYSGNLENIIVSSLYVCFKADNSINDYFLFYYLKTELFNKDVLKNVEGGVRDYLFYENFARIIFSIPCVEEQTRIASFLSSIDEKIETENQILNQYKNQKAYLLQNMFV